MGLLDSLQGLLAPQQGGGGLLNDPDALLAIAGQLMGAKKGDNSMGLAIQQGASARNAAQERKRLEEQRKLQMEMQQMQVQQMRQQTMRQQQEQDLAQRFAGHQGGMNGDGFGPPAPAQGPDMQGFAQGLFGIDPARSMAMQAQLAPKPPESFTLSPGQRRYQGEKVVAEGPAEGIKEGTTREVKTGGNTITYERRGQKWELLSSAPTHKPDRPEKPERGTYDSERGIMVDPRTGQAQPVMQGGKPIGAKEKPLTESQANTSGYMQRMEAAEKIMAPLEKSDGKPGVREQIVQGNRAGEMLVNSLPGQGLPGAIFGGRSPGRQQYRQAQEDWVRAKLRKESGAVIADTEMAREITTYFPQVGDSQEVVKQKAQARRVAIEALKSGAGPQASGQIRRYNPATGMIE